MEENLIERAGAHVSSHQGRRTSRLSITLSSSSCRPDHGRANKQLVGQKQMDSLQIPNSSMMEGQSLEAESPHAAAAEIPQQRMMTMSPQQQQPGADFQQHEGVGAGSSLPHLDAGSVFLSVVVEDDSNLSFCAYNEDENTIYVETAHVTGFEVEEMVQQVLGTVRPTLMLLPNKTVCDHKLLALLTTAQDAAFLEADDGDVDENDGDQVSGGEESVAHPDLPPRQRNRVNNGRPRSIPYRITKTASLDARACKSAIMRLRLRSLERKRGDSAGPHHAGNHRGFNQPRHFPLAPTAASSARAAEVSHYHALASVIDFDSKTQVQAIGSLLAFLQTTVFQHVPGGLIPVNDVVQLQTSQFMKIHRDTLSSLNIFATEHHPLASAKGHGGGSKEGCSLFSLLDRTRTHAGRMRLREWMMKPLLSIPDIRTRQDGVELFLRPEFQSATHKLAELMRRVGGVTRILSRLHKAVAHPKDFIALPKAIAYALSVCEVLEQDFRFPLRQCMQSQHRRLAARDVDAQEHSARRHVTQDDPMTPSDDAVQQVDDEKCAEAYLDFLGHILDRCHVNVMEQVVGHMTTIVDEDATLASDSVVVVRGFSAELDEYKDTYDKLGGTRGSVVRVHRVDGTRRSNRVLTAATGIMLVFEKDLLVRVPWLRDSVKVIFFPQVSVRVGQTRQCESYRSSPHSVPDVPCT
jgi:MutS domain III